LYPAIGVGGDICCCQFPSPSPVGYVYADVQIFTNNVPSSVANQVGWQINISPSSCGLPVSGTGPQSGLKINIGNCTQVTLTIQATSVPSGVSCTPLTASATVNAGQTAVLALSCSPAPSPTPQQYWTLNVNVNDPYGAGYIITDNYGNSLQAARSLTTSFANYPSNVSSVTLNAKIQFNPPNMQCSISPSTVTVSAPSGGTGSVTQNFTVSCTQVSPPSTSPYSVDVRLVNVDYGIGTPGSSTVCVTVTAKYSGTSVSGCISPSSEFADLGNIQLTYSPDILQIQGNYYYVAPSQVQVTTSDAGSTIYFGVYNMPSVTYPTGLWIVHPSKVTVYKGPVTVPNAYTLINISNSPATVSPTVVLGTEYSANGLWQWKTWGTATVSPSSVTIQPGRAVSFTVSADLTNAPYDRNAESYDYFMLTSPSVLNPLGSIAEHCVSTASGPPCGVADYLEIWELPSTNIAFPQQTSTLPSLTGVSSQDVSNITSNCTSQVSGGGAGVTYITYNNWMQQSLPTCIVPQTTSNSLTISTTPGAITIPLSLSQAYVPGNYTNVLVNPSGPNYCLPPCSGTPPVVVKSGIDVTVYLLFSIKHSCYYYGSYNVEVKYSVVGQQSGKVYASGDTTLGPYDNSCDGAYEVYKLSFTMPNEPVVLTASVYATSPSENVIGMPSVFPLKLGSVTAQFMPMQCQAYDNYGSVGTVVMLPKSGPWPTSISDYPVCAQASSVLYVSAGTTTPNALSDYATCVTYVPVNQWSGFGEIPCGSLTGSPSYNVCNNAAIVGVNFSLPSSYANQASQIGWKITTSCGATVTGQGPVSLMGVPLNVGPPNCSNPTLTFELTNVPQGLSCYAFATVYDGASIVQSSGNSITVSVKPCTYGSTSPTTPLVVFWGNCSTAPSPPGQTVSSCPSGTIAVTDTECLGEYFGQCVAYLSGQPGYCCCKPSAPLVSLCSSGTTQMEITQCIIQQGTCTAYLANQPGYCCCSVPSKPPGPPAVTPTPTATPTPTPTTPPTVTTCPSGTNLLPLGNCYMSNGTCVATPSGMSGVCCCQLPSPTVTPTPTPTVVTPTVTVPVGVPAVSPTPTVVTPTLTPPKVSKTMIGVIAGLAALGLAGGVYLATKKKKL